MALADPLPLNSFADKLKVVSVKWRLQEHQEMSGMGSGQILVADLGPALWTAEVALAPMYNEDAAQVQALIESLDGALRNFYLYAPQMPGPQYDPKGTILGASEVKIYSREANNKEMQLYGLPAGYKLTIGDFLAFDYGSPSRRAFHRILTSVTADGSGITPTFEVRPHLRSGVANDLAVTLVKPAAKVFIVPGSFDPGTTVNPVTTGMAFNVMQRIP